MRWTRFMRLTDQDIAVADAISDQITDLISVEIKRQLSASPKHAMPTTILVGQCLALLAFMRTAPQHNQPAAFTELIKQVERLLTDVRPHDEIKPVTSTTQ